jgi:hypothetical protein
MGNSGENKLGLILMEIRKTGRSWS